MSASLDELKAFAENLMAVCNHQVSKNRPLSKISVKVVAQQFLHNNSQQQPNHQHKPHS